METDKFVVVPFNLLPSESDKPIVRYGSTDEVNEQRESIRKQVIPKNNWELSKDIGAMELLRNIGSELIINAFSCNFKVSETQWNDDVEEANYLNRCISDKLRVNPDKPETIAKMKFFITSTEFLGSQYGDCAKTFKQRLGLETDGNMDLWVLRNVVMSPFLTFKDELLKEVMEVFRDVAQKEAEVCCPIP